MSMQLFGYWFKREDRFVSIEESERLFDTKEKEDLLKPLYENVKESPSVEFHISGVTYKQGELVEVRLSTGDEWQRRVLYAAAENLYDRKHMIACYNEDLTGKFWWTQIRKL